MSLLNYNEFLIESYSAIKLSEAKNGLFRSLAVNLLNEEEQVVFNFLLNEGLSDDLYSLYESEEKLNE
jgi:hypothetical protein